MSDYFAILARSTPTSDEFAQAMEDAPLEVLNEAIEERAAGRDKSAFNALRAEVHRRNGWGGCPVNVPSFDEYIARRAAASSERAANDYTYAHATPLGRAMMVREGYRPIGGVPVPQTKPLPMKQTSDAAGAAATLAPVQLIKVADIVPDPNNRKEHDAEALSSLAASIAQDGLLQPIVVRPVDDGKFMLIAGERRWCAHRLLKRDMIEARISNAASGAESTRKRLAENFHRVDLSPIEKAKDLAKLEADGLSQKEIAAFVGAKDQSTVSNYIRLLKLPKSVQAKVHAGQLSGAHAKAIARFERWPAVCEVIAGEALKRNTSSKELESGVPFEWELERKKLIVKVDLGKPYSFDDRPQYVLPKELQQDPDFLKISAEDWVCFAPTKWEPEKARQLAEHAKKQAAKDKTESGAQSKMSPAEKAARQKKIADNKRNRLETAQQMESAFRQLRDLKAIDDKVLTLLLSKVLANSHYAGALKGAATKLGLAVPKGLITSSWYATVSLKVLASMKPVDAVRLVAAAVVLRHGDEAVKYSHPVPEEVTAVLGKAKKGGK